MSKKTERLFGYYERELRLRYGARTVPNYLHDVGAFVDWLSERGLELTEVRAQDVESYQNALVSLRKKDGKAYSIGNQHNRLSAIKSLFRFLYERGYVLQNPTTKLDTTSRKHVFPGPFSSKRKSAVFSTKHRKTLRPEASATGPSSSSSTPRDSAPPSSPISRPGT